jgi:flavin-dependent thymidylate synthase
MLSEANWNSRPSEDAKWHKDSESWYVPPGKTKEIQRWADSAMFTAEPLNASEGPKVYLLSMTADPLGEIAACAKMYKGEVVRDMAEITDAERISYFEDMQRTALDAAFEVVQFHFLLEGVTRSFTHQLVRQRMGAVYFQESLRFAVKEDMAEGVALPPSLAGTADHARAGVPEGHSDLDDSDAQKMRDKWDMAVYRLGETYLDLVNSGMPAEDARGLLPHSITTRVHYVVNLRALKMHSGLRLCTQAQFEWRAVWARMIEAIREARVELPKSDRWPGSSHPVHMADRLAGLFKPICYQTGKCQFDASFDRKCSIRDRVNAFAEAGVKPADWEHGSPSLHFQGLLPIRPVEWLGDPSAAR